VTYVDTSAFYALADKGDVNHRRARALLSTFSRRRTPLVTTTDVFAETITLVRYRIGHRAAVKVGEKLLASSWCRVLNVSDEIRQAAWQILLRYDDQSFSFVDCTSFALMRGMRIEESFTFDRDFATAGFTVLPG
jgi:predicted nucleic acid-binding protein